MPCDAPVSSASCDAKGVLTSSHRRFCFPKGRRILAHSAFERVFAEGTEAAGRALVVRAARGAGDRTRLGVVVTKRTFRDAVDRNRAKRLIRESFRLMQWNFGREPWDIVVIARRKVLSTGRQEVQRELGALCRKLGVLEA